MSEHCIEIWRDVKGYEGFYQVSSWGRVKSLPRIVPMKNGPNGTFLNRTYRVGEKMLKGSWDGHYFHVILSQSWKEEVRLIHRLVLEAFVGPAPEGMQCRHLDGDSKNNQLSNVCWGTVGENGGDRVRHGTARGQPAGEGHSQAKLTETQVREIRFRTLQGERPCNLGREFNISEATIRDIRNRKSWKHI